MQDFQKRNNDIVNKDSVICKICHKEWKHLGSHLWHKHKILARDYKAKYGLPYRLSLTSNEVIKKKQKAQTRWIKLHGINFANTGKKYRFKKGDKRLARKMSKNERERAITNIQKENAKRQEWRNCPVCNIQYKHLESHLYNKHRLLQVK